MFHREGLISHFGINPVTLARCAPRVVAGRARAPGAPTPGRGAAVSAGEWRGRPALGVYALGLLVHSLRARRARRALALQASTAAAPPPLKQNQRFLRRLEEGYRPNPYHNATHAADVLQSLSTIIHRGGMATAYVDPLYMLACYTAAVGAGASKAPAGAGLGEMP
jgi:hypothetical protein